MKVLCRNVPLHIDKEQYQKYAASLLRSTYAAGRIVKKANADAYEPMAIHVKGEQRQEV